MFGILFFPNLKIYTSEIVSLVGLTTKEKIAKV